MAGDFFDINAPIEDRIPGVIVEPITTAGIVKVQWKKDQTVSHVHHTQLMHFENGETSASRLDKEHALVVEGHIPVESDKSNGCELYIKLKGKAKKIIKKEKEQKKKREKRSH